MPHYILRQTKESLEAKPSLLDEIVASYQRLKEFHVLDRAERMISVDYTGTLEELQKELKKFPEVKVSEEKMYRIPEPRVGIVKPVVPPSAPSPRRKRREK